MITRRSAHTPRKSSSSGNYGAAPQHGSGAGDLLPTFYISTHPLIRRIFPPLQTKEHPRSPGGAACARRDARDERSQASKRGQPTRVSGSGAAGTPGAPVWAQSKDQSPESGEINTAAFGERNAATGAEACSDTTAAPVITAAADIHTPCCCSRDGTCRRAPRRRRARCALFFLA